MFTSLIETSPFRPLAWRADRALELVEHFPRPLRPKRFDDTYVRVYRRYLVTYLAAGDEEAQQLRIVEELPHVHFAHLWHFSPDLERRQILEARLLTQESFDQIASRFGTDSKTIEYYERLFFDVRDRIECRDWIARIIAGSPEDREPNHDGTLSVSQRGYGYRMLGYLGGPLVLDVVTTDMLTQSVPEQRVDVADWFNCALTQITRSRALTAAMLIGTDQRNSMRLLNAAVRLIRAKAAKTDTSQPAQPDWDARFKAAMEYGKQNLSR